MEIPKAPFVSIKKLLKMIPGIDLEDIVYWVNEGMIGAYIETPSHLPLKPFLGDPEAEIFYNPVRIDISEKYCKLKSPKWKAGQIACDAITPINTGNDIKAKWERAEDEILFSMSEVLQLAKSESQSNGITTGLHAITLINTDNEKRDKSKDIKQCRKMAKEYVSGCKKNEIPSIAKAVKICHESEHGKEYTKGAIHKWVVKPPKIFPPKSSRPRRRKGT
jgi:hypothetical protein